MSSTAETAVEFYVANISGLEDADILKLFETLAPVRQFTRKGSGDREQYGFLVFQTPQSTRHVLDMSNGKMIGTKTLSVRRAHQQHETRRQQKPVFAASNRSEMIGGDFHIRIFNMDPSKEWRWTNLRDFAANAEIQIRVADVEYKFGTYGIIQYADGEARNQAFYRLSPHLRPFFGEKATMDCRDEEKSMTAASPHSSPAVDANQTTNAGGMIPTMSIPFPMMPYWNPAMTMPLSVNPWMPFMPGPAGMMGGSPTIPMTSSTLAPMTGVTMTAAPTPAPVTQVETSNLSEQLRAISFLLAQTKAPNGTTTRS